MDGMDGRPGQSDGLPLGGSGGDEHHVAEVGAREVAFPVQVRQPDGDGGGGSLDESLVEQVAQAQHYA